MSKGVVIWRLKSGADRRFKMGHPWVYSNELSESPKGIEHGDVVELHDASGKFLARGYGNPHSLIAFRALSREPALKDPLSDEALLAALQSAGRLRSKAGLAHVSHRLCFGEGDFLPGLIIDRYRLNDAQAFVVQAHTAGMDRVLARLPDLLLKYAATSEDRLDAGKTAIVFRNDVGVRKLEGLSEEEPKLVRAIEGLDLSSVVIRVPKPGFAGSSGFTEFSVDLLKGQKTGFFLDQAANIELAALRLSGLRPRERNRPLKILDLCCYVGQWGAKLAAVFRDQGIAVEVLAVDASAKALEFARNNIERQGARCETYKGDVLKDLDSLSSGGFDLVVSDPPALIKGRKDIPAGTHAYLQLNTQVFRLVREGGAVVSCSCSGLLEEEEFVKTLSKAAYRNRRKTRWIARGGHASDHPVLAEFPEGHYLKCWIGFAD